MLFRSLEGVLANIFQNIQRHGDRNGKISVEFKVVDSFYLIVVKNKISDSMDMGNFSSNGLESIKSYCLLNNGKARFCKTGQFYYSRLFFPIKIDCPVVFKQAS